MKKEKKKLFHEPFRSQAITRRDRNTPMVAAAAKSQKRVMHPPLDPAMLKEGE